MVTISLSRLVETETDLAGIVEVGYRGAPIDNNRIKREGIQDTPSADIPGFRRSSPGYEIKTCEIRLSCSHGKLSQTVELETEKLDGHFFLLIRIFLHLYVHMNTGFRAGERFNLSNFMRNSVARLLQMIIFHACGRMIRKRYCRIHFFPFSGRNSKKPLPELNEFAEAYRRFILQACGSE